MRTIKVADDVFQFAREHCDGAALWLKPAFANLHGFWLGFLNACEEAGCQVFQADGDSWEMVDNNDLAKVNDVNPPPGLYMLVPKLDQLQFFFVHDRPRGPLGVFPDDVPPNGP